MHIPRDLASIQEMIRNEVQESLHLDYKRSSSLSRKQAGEISKDVSAFANSNGGVLVYGVEESEHLPVRIDGGSDITREWLENILTANISPRIEGVEIVQIPISLTHALFVVVVPRSVRGPHQDRHTWRYYKRYNFKSSPMEDYEIADVRSRSSLVRPLVNIDTAIRHRSLMFILIENIGDVAAEDVSFSFEPELTWRQADGPPALIKKGVRYLAAGKRHHVFFGAAHEVLEKEDVVCSTMVTVTYLHSVVGRRISDSFMLDFADYLGTWAVRSDVEDLSEKVEKGLKEVSDGIKKVVSELEEIGTIAGPSGLNLSVTAVRNFHRLANGFPGAAKLIPRFRSFLFYQEVLEVDRKTARLVDHYYWQHNGFDGIESVEGLDAEVVRRIRERLLS